MLRKVLVMQKRVLREEHPDTLTFRHNLPSSLSHQGNHAESEEIQREVLAVRKRVLKVEHPNTLKAANNLASSLSRQR